MCSVDYSDLVHVCFVRGRRRRISPTQSTDDNKRVSDWISATNEIWRLTATATRLEVCVWSCPTTDRKVVKSSQAALHQKVPTPAGSEISCFTTFEQRNASGSSEQLKMKRNETA